MFSRGSIRFERRTALPILLLAATGVCLAVYTLKPRSSVTYHTILVGDEERSFRMAAPARIGSSPNSLRPVVFVLHGALDDLDRTAVSSGMDRLAEEEGCLVVYLAGRHQNWPPFIPPENPSLAEPDITYFEAMCELVVEEYGADPRRICVVGVSQGGCMTNLLVANSSSLIAAAVCNCGWLPKPLDASNIETTHKCPMLFLSGTTDTQVPTQMVREAHDAFTSAGHPCEFELLPGVGHGWNDTAEITWRFLRDKSLPEERIADR